MQTAKRNETIPSRKNDISLLKLDDFVRAGLLDPIIGYSTSKCFEDYKKIPKQTEVEILQLLKAHNLSDDERKCISKTIISILSLYFKDPFGRLEAMAENYLQLFDPNSGVTVQPCNRYDKEDNAGICLVATRDWKTGELLPLKNFSSEFEEIPNGMNEYSVTKSSNNPKKKNRVWLGPLAILNHACEANAQYYIRETEILVKVSLPIKVGDEIFVSYGINSFGDECKCLACEKPLKMERDVLFQSETRSRPIRQSVTTKGYTDQTENELKKSSKQKGYMIFKKMFAHIKYPAEFEPLCSLKEAEKDKQMNIITIPDKITDFTIFIDFHKRISNGALLAPIPCQQKSQLFNALCNISGPFTEMLKMSENQKTNTGCFISELLGNIHKISRQLDVSFDNICQEITSINKKKIMTEKQLQTKAKNRAKRMADFDFAEGDSELLPGVKAMIEKSEHRKSQSLNRKNDRSADSESPENHLVSQNSIGNRRSVDMGAFPSPRSVEMLEEVFPEVNQEPHREVDVSSDDDIQILETHINGTVEVLGRQIKQRVMEEVKKKEDVKKEDEDNESVNGSSDTSSDSEKSDDEEEEEEEEDEEEEKEEEQEIERVETKDDETEEHPEVVMPPCPNISRPILNRILYPPVVPEKKGTIRNKRGKPRKSSGAPPSKVLRTEGLSVYRCTVNIPILKDFGKEVTFEVNNKANELEALFKEDFAKNFDNAKEQSACLEELAKTIRAIGDCVMAKRAELITSGKCAE